MNIYFVFIKFSNFFYYKLIKLNKNFLLINKIEVFLRNIMQDFLFLFFIVFLRKNSFYLFAFVYYVFDK